MTVSHLLIEAGKGAVVGGLIGYVTNQLAVWMLFHPKKKMTFLGMGIPLTPGLVVKNQERIAESIGKAVARDLLDSETVISHLNQLDLVEPLTRLLRDERNNLKQSEKTLEEILGVDHGPALKQLKERLSQDLAQKLGDQQDLVHGALETCLQEFQQTPLGNLLSEGQKETIKQWLLQQVGKFLSGPQGEQLLAEILSEGIHQLPSTEAGKKLFDFLRKLMTPNLPHLAEKLQQGLATFLGSETFAKLAQKQLADKLFELIVTKFPMAVMLVNADTIHELLQQRWEDIVEEAQALLKHEELKTAMESKIEKAVDLMLLEMGKSLENKETTDKLGYALSKELQPALAHLLEGPTAEKTISGWLDQLSAQPLGTFFPAEETAKTLSNQLLNLIKTEKGQQKIESMIQHLIDRLILKKPGREIANMLPEDEWDSVGNLLGKTFQHRALKMLPDLLENQIDLATIVTDKVKEFDSDKIEETINRVSGRELKGIVRLGGLIGLLVGAIMQVIYSLGG